MSEFCHSGGVVTEPCEDKIVQLLANPLDSITILITSTSTTVTTPHSHFSPPPITTGVTGEGATGDNVKVPLETGRRRTHKPLLQALKGITGMLWCHAFT